MPFKCSVPNCRGNYDADNKVHIFSFPSDPEKKSEWLKAIPRKDFTLTKNARVCEKHFRPEDIEWETSAFDDKIGCIITAPLIRPRLKASAVPQMFPKCPQYLSKETTSRESPAEKKLRLESEHVSKAIEASVASKLEYDMGRHFKSFDELLVCADTHKCSSFWTKVVNNDILMYLDIKHSNGSVVVDYAVTVDATLKLSVSLRGECINEVLKVPWKVENITELLNVLDQVEKLTSVETSQRIGNLIDLLNMFLRSLKKELPLYKSLIELMEEQIFLLNTPSARYRYSTNILIFSSMLHIISPQAYGFIRQSGLLILPHPCTINNLNSKVNSNPRLELDDSNFLGYIRKIFRQIKGNDKHVSLMMDEIHLKPVLDYKGGDVVGMSFDNTDIANSAHVFMINSLFSKYKDVVHILPTKRLNADNLFTVLRKIIVELENIGFKVIVIVSDNNSINRKAVSLFNNPVANYVYPHPCNPNRPLFFCIDSVHLIKSVRNNWLNQKNNEQAMYYPDFETGDTVCTASFQCLKKVYEVEENNLLKHGYTLTRKSLWPTNFERQNVSLALKIFNCNLSQGLIELGELATISNIKSTAKYIEIFTKWFDIMNVKSPNKGFFLRKKFCEPLTNKDDDDKYIFLHNFILWLNKWENLASDTGRLTKETHSALLLTTTCMIELSNYCTTELGMSYILPGKIQTDELESRFGSYRRLAGTQYHVSIRQVYEIESKLRVFSVMKKLSIDSSAKGIVQIEDLFSYESLELEDKNVVIDNCFLDITVSDDDLNAVSLSMPLLTYIAGYCIHSVLNRIKCNECRDNLTLSKILSNDSTFKIIHNSDRGGLKFPSIDVLNVIVHNFIVVKHLLKKDFEEKFLKVPNQRQLITEITIRILCDKDMTIATCGVHSQLNIMKQLMQACSNTLLKNYCKNENDNVNRTVDKNNPNAKRKLKTFKK